MRGFTIIEVILAIAVAGVIATLTTPLIMPIIDRGQLTGSANQIVKSLRTAQQYAQGVKNDSPWGVYLTANAVTVFAGTSYVTRNITLDVSTPISPPVSITSGSEVVFNKLTGAPTAQTTTTIVYKNQAQTITTNAIGNIVY